LLSYMMVQPEIPGLHHYLPRLINHEILHPNQINNLHHCHCSSSLLIASSSIGNLLYLL
jgi:hypothetical protein